MITVNTREEFLTALKERLPEQPTCVEIGVLYGDFAKLILDIIKPHVLLLVDPYREGDIKYGGSLSQLSTSYSTEKDYDNLLVRFKQETLTGQVLVSKGFSFEVVSFFVNKSFNFIYHDASHTYEDLKRDMSDWLPKLKEEAVCAGHDYINFEGFGVIQAVDEFCIENNYEMFLYNSNGGDWALKRKEIVTIKASVELNEVPEMFRTEHTLYTEDGVYSINTKGEIS